MRRVQLTLSEPVWRALKLAVMDSQMRASEIVEGLIRAYVMVKPPELPQKYPAAWTRECSQCHARMPDEVGFCPECGHEMEAL